MRQSSPWLLPPSDANLRALEVHQPASKGTRCNFSDTHSKPDRHAFHTHLRRTAPMTSAAPSTMSARRADYCAWIESKERQRAAPPPEVAIEPCDDTEPLADLRGALKKLKHDSNFLRKIFDNRDRQLFPRDLLVASVPSRKKGRRRPIGLLRRSFTFDKEKSCRALTIDFVWVLPEFRSCGIGRQLMSAGLLVGKPKDVHLQVAGSDDNRAAVALYSSLGFRWDEAAPKHTEMLLEADRVEAAAAAFGTLSSRAATPTVSGSSSSSSSVSGGGGGGGGGGAGGGVSDDGCSSSEDAGGGRPSSLRPQPLSSSGPPAVAMACDAAAAAAAAQGHDAEDIKDEGAVAAPISS